MKLEIEISTMKANCLLILNIKYYNMMNKVTKK